MAHLYDVGDSGILTINPSIGRASFNRGPIPPLRRTKMPEWLHKQLAENARKKGLKGKSKDAYIYGTLQKYESQKALARKKALKKRLGG